MHSENSQNQFKIIKNLLVKHKRKMPPSVTDTIAFGATTTDHMLVCDFIAQKGGWQTPEITPFSSFTMRPDALVFHYGQTIFEGMKAFKGAKNKDQIFIFRPDMNAKRMHDSAIRLAMEPFPVENFIRCVKELVHVDRDWVLPLPGSLYIRPAMIPLDDGVSYRASKNYRFFIFLSPAKDYFQSGQVIRVYIERKLSRVAVGGCGEAKCGGNYAAALQPMAKAKGLGAEQILWLDAAEHKYVEEAGAMNVMFVYGNKIVTPQLSGSILHGVTRDSILKIAADLGYETEEAKMKIDDVILDIKSGKLTEVFACGTAAVVSPIGYFHDNDETIAIGNGAQGPVSMAIKKRLLDIQTGEVDDKYNWLLEV
ncbi:MAG: branched-chain amino acid aminotransferase [Bdellovibrionota bacterium]